MYYAAQLMTGILDELKTIYEDYYTILYYELSAMYYSDWPN